MVVLWSAICIGLLLALAWYPCGCSNCPCITRRPDVLPVTLAGFVSGECGCSLLNATFMLPYSGSVGTRGTVGNVCNYHGRYSVGCGSGGTREVNIDAGVAYAISGGTDRTYWVVLITEVAVGAKVIAHFFVAVVDGDYEIDCDATRTLNLVGVGTSTWCGDRSGATCQVN